MRPRVLLSGASGQIGRFAIPRLLNEGFSVLAVSRGGRPENYPCLRHVEWLDQAAARQVCQSCEYLLSAGPIQLAASYMREAASVRTAVIFSSSSLWSKRASDNPAEKRQMEEMLKLEQELLSYSGSPDVNGRYCRMVIFRPTLVYGCGLDANITMLANWIRRYGFMPVNGRATGLRQPVHADDLAAAAVVALRQTQEIQGVFALCGGDTLSYDDMVERLFVALDRPVKLLRLPQWLFVMLARGYQVFNTGVGINAEMVKRQCTDLVFDDSEARRLLDYKPRPFAPGPADLTVPGATFFADLLKC